MANRCLFREMVIRWRDQVREVTKQTMDKATRAATEEWRTGARKQDPCL
jgi:hypothetical protein